MSSSAKFERGVFGEGGGGDGEELDVVHPARALVRLAVLAHEQDLQCGDRFEVTGSRMW